MLNSARPDTIKAAPMLRVRGAGLRLCIRPIAFGNALGGALGASINDSKQQARAAENDTALLASNRASDPGYYASAGPASTAQAQAYQQFQQVGASLPADQQGDFFNQLETNGKTAIDKLYNDPNLYFNNPEIQTANARDSILNFAQSDRATRDTIFNGGVNGALALNLPKYGESNDYINASNLPLPQAYIGINGDKGGNGYTNFLNDLNAIGINSSNAARAAAYLVLPGLNDSDVLADVKYQLGTGFNQKLSQSADVQNALTERLSGSKPGQLINITDFYQAAVGDTVQRAYNTDGGGYFRDVVDNDGTVPIFSKLLGNFNFKSIVGTDDLAPPAFRDYNRRSLAVDSFAFLASSFLPIKPLGAALRGEASLAEGRIGFAGLQQQVDFIGLGSPINGARGGTFESIFHDATGIPKYTGPKIAGTYNGAPANTVPDLVDLLQRTALPGITDLKNVGVQALDKQLQIQLSIAQAQGVPFNVVVNPNTLVYQSVIDAAKAQGGNVYRFNPISKAVTPLINRRF